MQKPLAPASTARAAFPRRLGLPAVAAVAAGLWAAAGGSEAKLALALADPGSQDLDVDGLNGHQEEILGTSDLWPDSDGDQYYDLVELARGTDPQNANETPGPQSVHVGITARSQDGLITVVTAIYANHAYFPTFGFEMGLSYGGQDLPVSTTALLAASELTLHPTLDASGTILVLETPVPHALVQDFGYLGIYALVSDGAGDAPHASTVLNLFDFGGEPVSLRPAPAGVMQGVGSIYQPLGRGEDLPASTWDDGLVCWQRTEVVGSDGASVVLDVEEADCEEFDSSCNASQCSGSVGGSVEILDAGALVGGS